MGCLAFLRCRHCSVVATAPECVSRLGRVRITASWAPHASLIGVSFSNLLALHKQNIILITLSYTDGSDFSLLFFLSAPCGVPVLSPVMTDLRL